MFFKARFPPNFNSSSAESRLYLKIPFDNNLSLVQYLSYVILVTYVPVLGVVLFQFPCEIFLDNFLRRINRNKNWSLLFLQTAKLSTKKESCC